MLLDNATVTILQPKCYPAKFNQSYTFENSYESTLPKFQIFEHFRTRQTALIVHSLIHSLRSKSLSQKHRVRALARSFGAFLQKLVIIFGKIGRLSITIGRTESSESKQKKMKHPSGKRKGKKPNSLYLYTRIHTNTHRQTCCTARASERERKRERQREREMEAETHLANITCTKCSCRCVLSLPRSFFEVGKREDARARSGGDRERAERSVAYERGWSDRDREREREKGKDVYRRGRASERRCSVRWRYTLEARLCQRAANTFPRIT